MNQLTLEEYISRLTPDEREKHQSLIKECVERKKLLREYTEKTNNSIQQCSVNLKNVNKGLADIEKYIKIHQDLTYNFLSDLVPLFNKMSNNGPSAN
jgi:hypothetical protein